MPQRVEGSIEIEVPVERVYGYWETLENLPQYMTNVEEVTPTGPDTTHWRVKGLFGRTLEWEARTTQRKPNSAIGWNTVGGEVGTSGQVSFQQTAPNRTRVDVTMNYADPPGGRVGELVSRAVANPTLQLQRDLRNLKEILEGRTTPEEVQQQPAANTIQSWAMTFVASSVGLVLFGAGAWWFLLLRRQRSQPETRRRFVLQYWPRLRGRS